MSDTYWTAEFIDDTTCETYSHDDPDVCREWLLDTIDEAYGLTTCRAASLAAFLAETELTLHEFSNGDFNGQIFGTIVRVCADFDQPEITGCPQFPSAPE